MPREVTGKAALGGAVAVAVSGGVDSAAAALLLRDAGAAVHAVHLRLWRGGGRHAQDPAAAEASAADIASRLGLPFSVLDLRPEFDAAVVEPFVAAYLGGLTPNPCVGCNPFRLARLAEWAVEHDIETVATGHYAGVERHGDVVRLCRGADPAKDQSYMLAALPDALLGRLALPLGELTKTEVRELAARAGLGVADAGESQEVCFAPGGYRRFLEERGVRPREGRLVAEDGRELGRHRGHWLFTVGQRRGLGLGGGPPRYVLERRASVDEVVVGPAERLVVDEVDVVALDDRGRAAVTATGEGDPLEVQLRYRSAPVAVAATSRTGDRSLRLRLERGFSAAAPGQAAVLYRGQCVVGCGLIGGQTGV